MTASLDHGSALAQIAGLIFESLVADGVCKPGDLTASNAAAGAANVISRRPDLLAALAPGEDSNDRPDHLACDVAREWTIERDQFEGWGGPLIESLDRLAKFYREHR